MRIAQYLKYAVVAYRAGIVVVVAIYVVGVPVKPQQPGVGTNPQHAVLVKTETCVEPGDEFWIGKKSDSSAPVAS